MPSSRQNVEFRARPKQQTEVQTEVVTRLRSSVKHLKNMLANMFASMCSKAMLLQMSDNRLVDEILVLHPQIMAGVL